MKILAIIYKLITSFRNHLYDRNILKARSIPNVKVICIGNIVVGGTGKTPAVQYFAKKYKDEGKKVAIVSRGYKGKRKSDPLVVSDGKKVLVKASESGDEAFLHAIKTNDTPVIVGKNRYEASKVAYNKFNVDIILLDDGFQHRKFFRDVDILLIDATNPFGDNWLLPYGYLRESLKGIYRANKIIITKYELVNKEILDQIVNKLKKYNKPIYFSEYKVTSLKDLNNKSYPLSFIKSKDILLFSGVARPVNIEKTIKKLEPNSIIRMDFTDHYNYTLRDFENIIENCKTNNIDMIITTEKDMIKIPKNYYKNNIFVLEIEFILKL